jgi:hypothetical protein
MPTKMKKIYEEIKKIITPSDPEYRGQRFKDIGGSDVSGSKKQTSTSSSNRSTSSSRVPPRVTPVGPPDGLPKRWLTNIGKFASSKLAIGAQLLLTPGNTSVGDDERPGELPQEVLDKRAKDREAKVKYERDNPKPSGWRDDSGIEYNTLGNPMRNPNKEAMATHSAITKKSPIPQASTVRRTTPTTRRSTSANTTTSDSSNQTTPDTYFPNTTQAKVEPKPEPKVETKPELKVEPKPVPNNTKSNSEPAFPEPKPEPAKPEPAKPEPAKPEPAKPEASDLAKEYIKANPSNNSGEKPEDKVKRVKIIKPQNTSESSTLSRVRRIINEKRQVNEVVGAGRSAMMYAPTAVRWGYRLFKDLTKDQPKPNPVTTSQARPAPKTEVKPYEQPSAPAPVPVPAARPAPAARRQEPVVSREVVVRKEPPVKKEVAAKKEPVKQEPVVVKQEPVVVKQEPAPVPVVRPAPVRVIPKQPAPVPVRVRPSEPAPVQPAPVPTVRPSEPAPVPVVKPEAKPQTSTQLVKTTTTTIATQTEPETESKLKRVLPPPPPPPVDTKDEDDDNRKRRREIRFPTDPQPIKKYEPRKWPPVVPPAPPEPGPQPNNVVPPPPPPPKLVEPPKPAPQPNNVVPTPEPKPAPSQTVPDCPTGDCDPNLDVKTVHKRMASYTPKGFTRREKQQFSMESTQMNINKKFNVSDSLYQSVMEVMSKAKKPGSVPGNQTERDLAAKHGDPDRITHGDILVARGVVKSNDPVKKSKVAEGTMRNGKYVDDAPRPGTNELPVPDEGYRGPGKPLYTPVGPNKPAKKVQPGSTTKAMDDMEEDVSVMRTAGNIVGGVEKKVRDTVGAVKKGIEDFGTGRSEVLDREATIASQTGPAMQGKLPRIKENKDTPGNSYEHQCAIHVKSESFGEGRTITTQHADPDQYGNIAWYDVMFEHGIEKYVPTSELEILVSESHMHAKRKKKVTEDADTFTKMLPKMGNKAIDAGKGLVGPYAKTMSNFTPGSDYYQKNVANNPEVKAKVDSFMKTAPTANDLGSSVDSTQQAFNKALSQKATVGGTSSEYEKTTQTLGTPSVQNPTQKKDRELNKEIK